MRGYTTITRITDFGPYITKIILPFPETVSAKAIKADQFSVYVEHLDKHTGEVIIQPEGFGPDAPMAPRKGYVPVKKAYPSDKDGQRLPKGNFVTLEMDYGPMCGLSSGLSIKLPSTHEYYHVNAYRITQIREIEGKDGKISGLFYDTLLKNLCPDTEGFLESVSSYEKMPLRYGYFVPQEKGDKKPLIIFLHGMGEGGEDTAIAYSGNKVVALARDPIQSWFGGAYVFVPQCPTLWMDDGDNTVGKSGRSIYVKALKAAIDEFVEKNPGIDRSRIYIGGDSNGGFMTMRMIIDYPKYFAGAFPICEALYDHKISDEEIQILADTPVWFTHAKNDPIVPPAEFVLPTYRRMIKAGAKNVHFSFWDGIHDIHEGFQDAEGNAYEYLGHFSWIPVLDNDCDFDFDGQPVLCDGEAVSLFQWLAKQKTKYC